MKKILIFAFLCLAGCSDTGQVSGVYVHKSDNELLFVQIVKTDDGILTGRGETVAVMADGSLKDESFPLEGSVDGTQLSLKSNVFLGLGPSFSGAVSGNTLTLVSDGGQTVLKRTTLEDFTLQKNNLSDAAKSIVATNERVKNQATQQSYLTA
jgi:hypothetical protein